MNLLFYLFPCIKNKKYNFNKDISDYDSESDFDSMSINSSISCNTLDDLKGSCNPFTKKYYL